MEKDSSARVSLLDRRDGGGVGGESRVGGLRSRPDGVMDGWGQGGAGGQEGIRRLALLPTEM